LGEGRFIDSQGVVEVPENRPRDWVPPPDPQSLLRRLTGVSLARFEIAATGGPFTGSGEWAGVARLRGVDVDMPLGHLSIGHFEWARFSATEPFRFRATAFQSHGGFFCVDSEGHLKLPYVGKLQGFCRPDSKTGMGFTLGEIQSEPGRSRFSLRWLEARVVLNLLGNGHGTDSLSRRFDFFVGTGAESTYWSGAEHHLRAVAGVQGLFRTDNSRWELSTRISIRPSIYGTPGFWKDKAWEGEISGQHHLPISDFAVASFGLTFRYDRTERPAVAIGSTASIERTDQWNALVTIGGRFEFAHY
jgi:hypothetical protein